MTKPLVINIADEPTSYKISDEFTEFVIVLNNKRIFNIDGVLVVNLITGTLILFTTNYNLNNSQYTLKTNLLNIIRRLTYKDTYNFQLKIIDLLTIFEKANINNHIDVQFKNKSAIAFIQNNSISTTINLISELKYSALNAEIMKYELSEFVNSLKSTYQLFQDHNYSLIDNIELMKNSYVYHIDLNINDLKLLKNIAVITEDLTDKTKRFYTVCKSLHEYEYECAYVKGKKFNSKIGSNPIFINNIKIQSKTTRNRECGIQLLYGNILNYIYDHNYDNSVILAVKCLVGLRAYENVMSRLNTLLIKTI